jgi:predicted ATPase
LSAAMRSRETAEHDFQSPRNGFRRHACGNVVGRVASPRFVGRRAELDALRTVVNRAADGVGSVVLVGGEPGIGKSRLVAKLCAQARRDGVAVLIGECLPLGDGELPYAPIVSVLRSLARDLGIEELTVVAGSGHDELTRLAPDLRPPDQLGDPDAPSITAGGGSQARLFEQLLAVFVAVARRKPLLLVVEDVHWSDQATRDFLSFLVRAVRAEPIAIVITYRSDDVARTDGSLAFVHELERSGQALRMALTALDRQEIRDLVAAIREQDPDPLLIDRLHARAEGNPFFTEELLASADAPDAPLPESLAQALLLRLAGCPADVAAVVRTVAVAGREIEHAMLESAVALPHDRLVAALRDAVARNVLVHAPGATKYGFRHALLGEAAYSELLPIERESLHRTLAGVLARRPELGQSPVGTAARLAHHWYAAGEKRLALPASIDAGAEPSDGAAELQPNARELEHGDLLDLARQCCLAELEPRSVAGLGHHLRV